MELTHGFTLRARLEPAVAFGAGLLGERVFLHAVEGTVEGERLRGTLLPGGGDRRVAHPSGWGVLDVRAQFRTHDGALVSIHYPGLVEMDAAFGSGAAHPIRGPVLPRHAAHGDGRPPLRLGEPLAARRRGPRDRGAWGRVPGLPHLLRVVRGRRRLSGHEEAMMVDTLGWRLKLGVLVPSTNISVQPEYDAMRPPGVTDHVRGFRIPDAPTRTDAGFARQLENVRATMVDAMDEVLTLEPDHVILATAAESAGGVAGAKLLHEKLLAKSDGRVGVTLGADAIVAALHRHGGIGRIGLVTPHMPVGDEQARRFFEDGGFAVARVKGLRCASPVLIAHVPRRSFGTPPSRWTAPTWTRSCRSAPNCRWRGRRRRRSSGWASRWWRATPRPTGTRSANAAWRTRCRASGGSWREF
jgi:maleate isomerase